MSIRTNIHKISKIFLGPVVHFPQDMRGPEFFSRTIIVTDNLGQKFELELFSKSLYPLEINKDLNGDRE